MLVLYETALGYCLFKVSDSAKIESADLWKEFETPQQANKLFVPVDTIFCPRGCLIILFFQTEAEGSAPVHVNGHCGGRYFCHTKWEDRQGIETVSNRRSTGEGKGQGVSGGY